MLPTPYSKDHQPFEHFEHPEALARHRVRGEIRNGSHEQNFCCATSSWYGHSSEINGDDLIVTQCAGVAMRVRFNFRQLVREELQRSVQPALFIQ